jgi:hypothetical protein
MARNNRFLVSLGLETGPAAQAKRLMDTCTRKAARAAKKVGCAVDTLHIWLRSQVEPVRAVEEPAEFFAHEQPDHVAWRRVEVYVKDYGWCGGIVQGDGCKVLYDTGHLSTPKTSVAPARFVPSSAAHDSATTGAWRLPSKAGAPAASPAAPEPPLGPASAAPGAFDWDSYATQESNEYVVQAPGAARGGFALKVPMKRVHFGKLGGRGVRGGDGGTVELRRAAGQAARCIDPHLGNIEYMDFRGGRQAVGERWERWYVHKITMMNIPAAARATEYHERLSYVQNDMRQRWEKLGAAQVPSEVPLWYY